jgi:hypothetical protein
VARFEALLEQPVLLRLHGELELVQARFQSFASPAGVLRREIGARSRKRCDAVFEAVNPDRERKFRRFFVLRSRSDGALHDSFVREHGRVVDGGRGAARLGSDASCVGVQPHPDRGSTQRERERQQDG